MENKGFKVLIVDDEIDICYLLSGMLRQKAFKTSYVNTLSDATSSLHNDIPDIVFLDNHLADGLGMDYIPYIKKNYPLVRVVMITAHDSQGDKNNALKNGADAFLGKPLTREAIYGSLDAFMIPRPAL